MREEQLKFLDYILLGNEQAVAFFVLLSQINQTWDDLIDGDNPELTHDDINAAFWNLLVALPRNTFYVQHFDTLNPLLQAAVVDWWDSNELQNGTRSEKAAAYTLRDTLTTIAIHCARLIGGFDWMRSISMDVRRRLYSEDLDEFIEEHTPSG